jgi:hypothetical protein
MSASPAAALHRGRGNFPVGQPPPAHPGRLRVVAASHDPAAGFAAAVPNFPPLSLRSTLGRAGGGGTSGDGKGQPKLSTGHLCTSPAMSATRRG